MSMNVTVVHSIGRLYKDMAKIPPHVKRKGAQLVRTNAREGNLQAKTYARESSGAHGKHYPNVFTAEMITPFMWEYGPDADIEVAGEDGTFNPGGMATGFEGGSRNQQPHMDVARSADVIGRQMADDVSDMVDELFWL